jgi:hypothetical protein
MVNALAATQLSRRRRRAIALGTAAIPTAASRLARTAIAPRLRTALDSQVASPPAGNLQVSRLVNGPPPSARSGVRAGAASTGFACRFVTL